ncbi:MAG: hypothetical protein M3O22_07995 [Pseudomonadota bacterium]|nr:hypothetical protein [Pseudomonadota bacterium]
MLPYDKRDQISNAIRTPLETLPASDKNSFFQLLDPDMFANPNALYYSIVFICALISLVFSIKKDISLHKKYPDLKGYIWGYFTGMQSFLVTGIGALGVFYLASEVPSRKFENLIALGIFLACHSFMGVFIIRRNRSAFIVSTVLSNLPRRLPEVSNRSAFIVSTVLSINPLLWIINGIYIKNRWHELGKTVPFVNLSSFQDRLLIALSVFWFSAVVVFVLLFEPKWAFYTYPRRLHNVDWLWMLKIILFPPVLLFMGNFLFGKFVRQKT